MLQSGDVLDGKYTLIKLVGEGNVGAVWEAMQSDLKRSVALKVIRDDIEDPAIANLRREAEILASLTHPGITVVHDFVETDGDICFIVMEYLNGQNLEQVLEVRPHGLPDTTVLSMAVEIADALSAAHKHGLVHRDLKPANLFYDDGGRIKVCDFGIAVAAADAGIVASGSGYLTGTPQFMSPEQCDGAPVDARSDLYSLGCVLYALLTGQPPFGGRAEDVIASHRSKRPIPPRLFRPEISAELDEIVMRLLAKDRQDRPSDASSLASTLKELRRKTEALAPARSIASLSLPDLLDHPQYRVLLGLLAVVKEGLVLAEIEYLTRHTSLSSSQIQDVFRRAEDGIFSIDEAAAGRTITYRLAGETLRGEVTATLGAGQMRGYRDTLHEWADECRGSGWPEGTPSCLLASYARILSESRDNARLVKCATDAARHDLMFKVTGGDFDALAEIETALEALLAADQPDLRVIVEIAIHRDRLVSRGNVIPIELPAVWVMLGRKDRAEQLLHSIRDPSRRADAVAVMTAASAGHGAMGVDPGYSQQGYDLDFDPARRAQKLASQAHSDAANGLIDSARDLAERAQEAVRAAAGTGRDTELAELAVSLVLAGHRSEGELLRSAIRERPVRMRAQAGINFAAEIGYFREKTGTPGARAADIASACMKTGHIVEADIAATATISAYVKYPIAGVLPEIVRKLPWQYRRQVIQAVASAHAACRKDNAYDPRSVALDRDVRSVLGSIFSAWQIIDQKRWSESDNRLASAALRCAISGNYRRADKCVRSIEHPELRDPVLADIALAFAITGRKFESIAAARVIGSPQIRWRSLQETGIALAASGGFATVMDLIIYPISDQQSKDQMLALIAHVCLPALGYLEAVSAICSIADPKLRALTLAAAITEMSNEASGGLSDPSRGEAMRSAAYALAEVVHDSARTAPYQGRLLDDPDQFARMTAALVAVRLNDLAEAVAAESQAFARGLPDGIERAKALASAASSLIKLPGMQLTTNRQQVRSLVASALVSGPWYLSLRALGEVERELLAHIATLIMSQQAPASA
ncbi:MAG TPA: serine/threonine-protein kinase [Streptosporangiaceae bacterium]|nr:serine/threonine-protein kinase [Streptosporangiaceae bacterium]